MKWDVLGVGHASYDITLDVDEQPGEDSKVQARGMVRCGGGPAANGAVTAARLGGRAAFAGFLGEDLFGREHRRELQEEGVADGGMVVRGGGGMPLSVVLVKPGGRRSLVNYRRNRTWLKPGEMPSTYPGSGNDPGAEVYLFDGHEAALAEDLIRSIAGSPDRGLTVLDAGSRHPGTERLWRTVDFLVASEAFSRDMSGKGEPSVSCGILARQRKGPTAVTAGGRGLWWNDGAGGAGRVSAFEIGRPGHHRGRGCAARGLLPGPGPEENLSGSPYLRIRSGRSQLHPSRCPDIHPQGGGGCRPSRAVLLTGNPPKPRMRSGFQSKPLQNPPFRQTPLRSRGEAVLLISAGGCRRRS